MGFRLEINSIDSDRNVKELYYGTKLIGYENEEDLTCIAYLKAKGKDYPCTCYCFTSIVLDYIEAQEFLECYSNDLFRICGYRLFDDEEFKPVKDSLDSQIIIGYIIRWL